MAYDEQLAGRIRELISARPGVVERTMFGGLGWMIGGNMAVGVMRETELVARPLGRCRRRPGRLDAAEVS